MSYTGCEGGAADPCAPFSETAITCVPGLSLIASDGTDCGPIAASELSPAHAFGQCSSPEETITVGAAGGNAAPTDLTMTELSRDQWGNVVFYTGQAHELQMSTNLFPQTVPVPAVTNPAQCVLIVQVTFGGSGPSISGPSVTLSDNANYAAPVNLYVGTPLAGSISNATWILDPSVGATGSNLTLDFTDNTDDPHGTVAIFFYEVCDASLTPTPLSSSNFDIAGVVYEDGMVPLGTPGGTSYTVTSDPIDMGDCPALMFVAARHVDELNNDKTNAADVDWFQASDPGITEVNDVASVDDRWSCQMGSASAVIPAGTGSFTFDYTTNNGVASIDGEPGIYQAHAVGLDCSTFGATAGSAPTVNSCSIEITNPNCDQDGIGRCFMRGSVKLCPLPGETISAFPVVDGVVLADQEVSHQSPAGEATCETHAVSFPITDLTNVLAPGASATHTFAWQVDGIGDAEFSAWATECEVIHV